MAGLTKAERERRKAEQAMPVQAGEPAQTTVPMVRDESHPLPHACDVHPDEVANYALGGWRLEKQ